ncbi:hypothetical protein JCM19235_1957 [Vibrio maritimus]|uniref:Uncharacterized protein n=1 Tax=Vibrio maritimus TaxID=990268 RepID=A0A090RWG6_9VIBR|nr:hypothetical protein JCM19235_1957 [Vibrio maritimus]
MAGINTIGRLAVSMDLNSAKFSQKLRTVQKDVGKAETRMQKFSKAIGGLRTIAAAGGLASIVAGVQSIQQELQTATNFALDFNNAFTNDAVRANLIDYGEQMEALNRRQMQAGANMASNFAQFSYNIERMKTQIAELFSDGNENAVVTDADLEQARKNIVEKIGGGFEEAAGRASNFMLSGSFAGGADQLQKEAQRLANERADTNKRLYEEMMQTELQLTNLGLQRQFMSREEYTKKRIELTKRLAEIQANLDPDGLMEGTRWQERLDQLNLISEQQESWVKEQDEKDKQTKADREQREQEHQDKLAAIRAASIEKQRARERMIAEESAQQEIARMQQQFMSEEEQRELQFTTQMDQLNNYLDQDLITREQYNNLRTQLRDQWIQADLAANNSWQTQTLDSMVGSQTPPLATVRPAPCARLCSLCKLT